MFKISIFCIFFITYAVSVNAGDYYFQHADASVELNTSVLFEALTDLEGTTYKSPYEIPICGDPNVIFSLDKMRMNPESRVNTLTGSSSYSLNPEVAFKGRVNNCWGAAAKMMCQSQQLIKSGFDAIQSSYACKWSMTSSVGFRLGRINGDFFPSIDPLIKFDPKMDFVLQDTNDFLVEFGSFESGSWVANANRHLRTIYLTSSVHGALATSIIPSGEITNYEDPMALKLNFMVDKPFYKKYADRSIVEQKYDVLKDFDPASDLLRIVLRDSFFSKKTDSGESGFFPKLLPVRMQSKDDPKIDFVLDDARVELGEFNGRAVLRVLFALKSIHDAQYIKDSQASILFSAPEISSGEITFKLLSASLKVTNQSASGTICLDEEFERNIVSKTIKLATIVPELRIELPDCIGTGDPNWHGRGRCGVGQLERGGTGKNTKIEALYKESEIEILEGGAIAFSIPYKVVKY